MGSGPQAPFSECTKTTNTYRSRDEFWEVNFKSKSKVQQVEMQGWMDRAYFWTFMRGTKVFIDNQLCGEIKGDQAKGPNKKPWYTVKCDKPLVGNKVRIENSKDRRNYLMICGIKVIGKAVA